MNQKEQARLKVLNSLWAEQMAVDQAAELMGVSPRHTRRILAAYRREGVAALAHGHRGRRPPNATPETTRAEVLHLANTRYLGTNHTHLSELLGEREGIDIDRSTLRRILVSAGLKSPRRHRMPQHRVRRQRMPQQGMLIQLDGSYHRWLGDDGPQFTLLLAVDDATGAVVNALFCEREDSLNYFLLMQGLLRRRGIPLALYTDRHAVFKHKSEHQPIGKPTQFRRAMEELGIQMIFALSPQAKGRVERTAGTFQDRMVTELRLAGGTTMEQAKAVLKQFLPRFNRRFQVPAQCPDPAFRPLPADLRLGQVLCFKYKRRVARDNTVKFQRHTRHTLQLLPGRQRPSYAGATVLVLQGLDGRLSLQHEGRIIATQQAPPNPEALRNGITPSAGDAIPSPFLEDRSESQELASELLKTIAGEPGADSVIDDEDVATMTVTASPRRPTFLQKARWEAVQKAKLDGMSIRKMARELGLHRNTVRRYIDAERPPTRRTPATMAASTSGNIPD